MAKHEFTGVFIPAHIWLSKELLPAEKMILGEVEALSKKTGWCEAGRKHFAEWLQCTPENVSYYCSKLERLGFLESQQPTGGVKKMRVISERFYVQEGVNGVYGGGKWGLRGGVNGVYGGGKWDLPEIKDKYNNEIQERGGEEKTLPPPNGNSTLEAEKEKELTTAGGAAGEPVTQPPPHRIALHERPNAETPVDLEKSLRKFYIDWPTEWAVGILENGRGSKYPKERQAEIVKDFCCWAIENGRGMDTYQRLNARLQLWFRNEQFTGWKKQAANNSQTTSNGQLAKIRQL